ncbi:hypothetical protein K227x_39030 [Rubripirellula lacrimiformis]|uniref:Uncharacterized protein n=1 Tax=Rubripirellula lacrimiformis TaxID=1930273 RepID=A0A517NEE9_9BACT|nr:hypothetical protein [Rubripirellula lacrimiformis]QDT05503.1 hypothetical protein K227x_39030 [Rubripirellula lacrimiformis]
MIRTSSIIAFSALALFVLATSALDASAQSFGSRLQSGSGFGISIGSGSSYGSGYSLRGNPTYNRPSDRGGFGYGGNGSFGYPGAYPSNGFGTLYDPYARGSFVAPDLMKDPYFQYQHKFDSRYPGRYSSGRPAFDTASPARSTYHSHGHGSASADHFRNGHTSQAPIYDADGFSVHARSTQTQGHVHSDQSHAGAVHSDRGHTGAVHSDRGQAGRGRTSRGR